MGRNWIHAALASQSRFLIDLRLGPRTLETAAQLVASVAMVCCVGGILGRLLLLIDNHLPYPNAILQVLGLIRHRRRKRGRGRLKHPDLKAPPGLWVGVVDKVRTATGRLLRVKTRALFGPGKRKITRLIQRLKLGRQINTAHIERLNGTLRTQQQARLGRRTRNFSRRSGALQWTLWLWRDLYNWIHPHGSLDGRTPAMALGLTTTPWSVPQYVRQVVHVGDLTRQIWAEERGSWLTSALAARNRRKRLPTS
jgi:IS1 family transposase